MKKAVSGIFLFLFVANQGFAQCDNCQSIGKKADLCYADPAIPGKCIQFVDKDPNMYFCPKKGGKPVGIPLPKDGTTASLMSLLKSGKYKFKPEDILLVSAALPEWEKTRKNLGYQVTGSGLAYKITKQGAGKKPEPNKKVTVHYKGYLEDGTVFDNSYDRKQPIEFVLGAGRVIKGWDEGIQLFNVGGSGTLKIPPQLGYGKAGAGGIIPPDATLYFDIEVVSAE